MMCLSMVMLFVGVRVGIVGTMVRVLVTLSGTTMIFSRLGSFVVVV